MDFFIELSYPKNLDAKKKANFSTRFRRLVDFKIRRGEYLIDREDVLEKVKKLALDFKIGLKIIEYKELPPSLKEKLEKATKKSEIDEKILQEFDVLKKKNQEFTKKIKIMKKSLLYYDELFKKVAISDTLGEVESHVSSADSTIIEKGIQIAREEAAWAKK